MKISTAKTEIMCLSRHLVQCSLQTNEVTLQQTEKFKHLEVTFLSDGRQDSKLDTRIGKASAIMRQFVLKRKLCPEVKLFVFTSIFFAILTNGYEFRVMTKE